MPPEEPILLYTLTIMAKIRKRKKIYKIEDACPSDNYTIIGIKANKPIHNIAFDLNKSFNLQLYFHNQKLIINRNQKELSFDLFTNPQKDPEEKIWLVANETFFEQENPANSLFSSMEADWIYKELKNIDYLLFVPLDYPLQYIDFQQNFKSFYKLKWITVNMDKLSEHLPVFPTE